MLLTLLNNSKDKNYNDGWKPIFTWVVSKTIPGFSPPKLNK